MMGLGWILVLIVVVLLAGALFPRGRETPTSKTAPRASSLEIAERRYAGGEISKEEFESIKRGLA